MFPPNAHNIFQTQRFSMPGKKDMQDRIVTIRKIIDTIRRIDRSDPIPEKISPGSNKPSPFQKVGKDIFLLLHKSPFYPVP